MRNNLAYKKAFITLQPEHTPLHWIEELEPDKQGKRTCKKVPHSQGVEVTETEKCKGKQNTFAERCFVMQCKPSLVDVLVMHFICILLAPTYL